MTKVRRLQIGVNRLFGIAFLITLATIPHSRYVIAQPIPARNGAPGAVLKQVESERDQIAAKSGPGVKAAWRDRLTQSVERFPDDVAAPAALLLAGKLCDERPDWDAGIRLRWDVINHPRATPSLRGEAARELLQLCSVLGDRVGVDRAYDAYLESSDARGAPSGALTRLASLRGATAWRAEGYRNASFGPTLNDEERKQLTRATIEQYELLIRQTEELNRAARPDRRLPVRPYLFEIGLAHARLGDEAHVLETIRRHVRCDVVDKNNALECPGSLATVASETLMGPGLARLAVARAQRGFLIRAAQEVPPADYGHLAIDYYIALLDAALGDHRAAVDRLRRCADSREPEHLAQFNRNPTFHGDILLALAQGEWRLHRRDAARATADRLWREHPDYSRNDEVRHLLAAME